MSSHDPTRHPEGTTTVVNTARENAIALLTHVLHDQVKAYDRLLELIDAKREAIRHARVDAITPICEEERRLVENIRHLDSRRLEVVRTIAPMIGCTPENCTVSAIAEATTEHLRETLTGHAERLRARIEQARRQSSIVRDAATALAQHMSGLMHTISAALSQAGVYGRRGNVEDGLQVQFNVDIKS